MAVSMVSDPLAESQAQAASEPEHWQAAAAAAALEPGPAESHLMLKNASSANPVTIMTLLYVQVIMTGVIRVTVT